jgi:hypothetical protein
VGEGGWLLAGCWWRCKWLLDWLARWLLVGCWWRRKWLLDWLARWLLTRCWLLFQRK